ncbi:MAG: GTPase [Acholeplasma sp.]|nr:GTPase [Acholeplasma sp.]
MKNDYCLGCGIKKQVDNKNELGYVSSMDKELCYDCYQLLHYGKVTNVNHPKRYFEIAENSVVLIIQSVMQLDLLFSLPITRIQNNAKYVYIINQVDLLPKDTNLDLLHANIVKLAHINKINYSDIILMSALNKEDIKNLSEHISTFKESNIYLFGYQNSGKTTIFKGLTNNQHALNMNKSGLTQDVIIDKFQDKTIYDMPGAYTNGYLEDFFSYEEYKNFLPSKTMKPKIYQINNKQKLVIEDIFEFTISSDDKSTVVLYMNNNLKINRYNIANENDYLNKKFEYNTRDFRVNEKNKSQVTIADLGFIHLQGTFNISLTVPKGIHITVSEALFK